MTNVNTTQGAITEYLCERSHDYANETFLTSAILGDRILCLTQLEQAAPGSYLARDLGRVLARGQLELVSRGLSDEQIDQLSNPLVVTAV